jgi:hypothetical protein
MSIPKRDVLIKAGLLKRLYAYRSAITGRFVSKAYAEAHPDTTVKVQLRDVVAKY